MTQIDYIINLFDENPSPELTCTQVTKLVALEFSRDSKYLSGSVSGILRKLCDLGQLFVLHDKKGPKGGKIYKRRLI